MEETLKKASGILGSIGWVFLILAILFTIEIGFIFATLSLALWFAQFNADPSIVFLFMRVHNFMFQLTFIIFLFSAITYAISVVMKSSRERRVRYEEMRAHTVEEIRNQILQEMEKAPEFKLKKSRRKR